MAIIDRIKYDGNSNGSPWLIYKYPSEEFRLGSQLIVNQGQEVLFFKDGKFNTIFSPGVHTLQTGNLPFVYKLVNMPFGGKTPFAAEVYYINKTSKLDMHWGMNSRIPIEDPKYGTIVRIAARASYGVTICDSQQFVAHIIGAASNGHTCDYSIISEYFTGLINSYTKSNLARFMICKEVSFLEITMFLTELSEEFQNGLNQKFNNFGVEVISFNIEAIVPRSEDIEVLEKYKMEQLQNGKKTIACPKCGAKVSEGRKNCDKCGGNMMWVTCPSCGKNMSLNAKFCKECGKPLGICSICGTKNMAEDKFCGNCGKPLGVD